MKNRVLNSLISYILKEKRAVVLLLGISMISSGIAVIQPLLMQKLIDDALIVKNIDNFFYLVFVIAFISIFSIALSVFLQYNYTKLSIKILYSLRIDIFEKIFLNKKLFFQRNRVGDLLSRLEGDISELQRFGVDSIFALFSAVFGLIGALFIMFYFDVTLAIFALLLFPIEFFLLKPMYVKMHDITKEVRQSSAFLGSFIIESFRYASFLKKFNNIDDRKENLNTLQDAHKNRILKQQVVQIKFAQIPIIISLIARLALIVFGGLKVINADITIGQLIAFLSYFSMVLSPVHAVLGILNNIPKLKVSINRLDEILPKNIKEKKINNLPKNFDIEFKNLSFSYPNAMNLFENLDLKIKAKEKIVLLGNNGIGKSTLIDLVLNNLEPNSGQILLDNKNIDEIENKTLQSSIGLVEQNPVIISTTLKENLLIANKSCDDSILLHALEKVGLLSWYKTLENGLETQLSEDGKNLSGGQKQRLSIARLILQNPSVVVMDEPTSSLDKGFVEIIDSLIDENFNESTKIIISHHDCYKNARVLKVENKNIKE
ncbi:ABC transporter ATP-binding protein [Arcobacter sp. LA11]|uniref:ABC transporter ATP-binding protein n=1 Tax=Arcobacter sp. LA11 TaxID=1898176 RepID=UPI00093386F0|nr:ABC transporter ATP-binding protein [Arcobacter sp. LA11]